MKTLSTLILIITLAAVAFPCGAPVVIEGRATVNGLPVPGTLVAIHADITEPPIEVVRASVFGYYQFEPVLPCNGYRVSAAHSKLSIIFTPVNVAISELPQDGSSLVINIFGSW